MKSKKIMILQNNVEVTRKHIEDEIQEYEELIEICEEMGLDGVIKIVNGKTEYWYKDDMINWIEIDEDLIRNEGD